MKRSEEKIKEMHLSKIMPSAGNDGMPHAHNNTDGTLISEVSKGKDGAKIKLADRMKALQWISDHMDLATEKQRAEIALLKSRADAGKDDRESKLDKFFEQIEGALKDAE